MRVLVVGAGATGGYFGGRLAAAGRDVTFLVRPARAEALARTGLVLTGPGEDAHVPAPRTVTAAALRDGAAGPFDLVLLSCKAYDLDAALDDVAPAVGPETLVLPILNGLRHLDALDARFGAERVLGGSCSIVATLGPAGEIHRMNDLHLLIFGERDGARTPRIARVETLMAEAGFQARLSRDVVGEMWEKWVFLATLAAATASMRGSVGDILAAPGGRDLIEGLIAECRAVAAAAGHPPRDAFLAGARGKLLDPHSTVTASMLRDIENGARIEADHIVGDLIGRGRALAPDAGRPGLERAYTALKTYEHRRARQAA